MSKTTSKQINEYNQMSLTVEKFKNQNCTKFIKQTFKNTRKFSFCFNKTSKTIMHRNKYITYYR